MTENQSIERAEFISRDKCPKCAGTGIHTRKSDSPFGSHSMTVCETCKGTGVIHWCGITPPTEPTQ